MTFHRQGGASATRRSASFADTESVEFDRGVSFFDAVYGFAITLLIAGVSLPPAEAWRSVDALLETGIMGEMFGFALSFFVIAVVWRSNVRLTRRLRGMDGATIFMNLLATAFVILIPFTTNGISDQGSSDYALPTVVYALNIAVVSLLQSGMYQVARVRGLEVTPTSAKQNRIEWMNALVTPVVFIASVPVTLYVDAGAGKLTWATLLVLGPLVGWFSGAALKREAAQRESQKSL